MESSKHVNSAEPASPESSPAFLLEFDGDFMQQMALQAEQLDGSDYICDLDYLIAPLSPSGIVDDKSQVEPQEQKLQPEEPVVPTLSPILTTLDTPPATPVLDNEMETDDASAEFVEAASSSASTSSDGDEELSQIHVEILHAQLEISADGRNKYERLLAKMPKSNAGRKRKSVTTNMSRNALAARENRDRKKEYMEELEENMHELNRNYKKVLKLLARRDLENRSLRASIRYYKEMTEGTKSSALQPEG